MRPRIPCAAAENWSDGEFYDRDDEALDSEGPAIVRERLPDGNWRRVPESEWKAAPPPAATAEAEAVDVASSPPSASDPAKKPYSVLLLYPDHVNDDGTETYYDFVEATDPIAAVAEARRHALATNEWTEEDFDPDDFVPLLVTEGHHYGHPTTND